MTFLGIGKKREDSKVSSAERYARMAEEALELGDANSAVEHYRAALQFAPLSRELRHAMADALLEKALAGERRKSGAVPRSSSVLGEVDIPAPAPARRKARPAVEPEDERRADPPRRRKVASSSVAHPAMRVRSERAPGFADLDELEETDSEEFCDHDAVTPRPRRESAPAALPKARPPRHHSSRRRGGRVWLMAAGYGAVLLIVAGIAHGVISRAIGDSLPSVEATAPTIPDGLTAKLNDAGELLADRKPAEALKVLEEAKSEFPDHAGMIEPATVQALRAEGSLHLQDRNYAKAAEAYEKATRIEPLGKDNWIDLGRALREGGRAVQSPRPAEAASLLGRAASAYQRALDVSSKDPAALYGLAQVRIFLNERGKAVDNLKKVIAVAPDTPEARQAERDLEQLVGGKN